MTQPITEAEIARIERAVWHLGARRIVEMMDDGRPMEVALAALFRAREVDRAAERGEIAQLHQGALVTPPGAPDGLSSMRQAEAWEIVLWAFYTGNAGLLRAITAAIKVYQAPAADPEGCRKVSEN
jgi:hypothetical protein